MMEKTQTQNKTTQVKRPQTKGEQIANNVSHAVMVIFSIIALVLLILKSTDGPSLLGAIMYGSSLIILFSASALYHAFAHTKAGGVFRRIDHSSIFLLIGGTYAPILLTLPALQTPLFNIEGALSSGLVMFIIQWSLIIVGIIVKSIWINKFKKFHYVIYIVLGWGALFFIKDLYQYSIPGFWLILGGGIIYTLGILFYTKSSRYKYFHFIWHLFVALAAIVQFMGIYFFIY